VACAHKRAYLATSARRSKRTTLVHWTYQGSITLTRWSTNGRLDHGVKSTRRPNGRIRICPIAAVRLRSAQPITLPGATNELWRTARVGVNRSHNRNAKETTSHRSNPLTARSANQAMASAPPAREWPGLVVARSLRIVASFV